MGLRCRHLGSFALPHVIAVLLLFISCGGSPGQPSKAGAVLTIVSSTDVLPVGASVDMTLQAVFADGSSTLITPLWGTDHPEIIDVQPLSASRQVSTGVGAEEKTGVIDHILFARVTGLAPGDAQVTAESAFGTCRRAIHVVAP